MSSILLAGALAALQWPIAMVLKPLKYDEIDCRLRHTVIVQVLYEVALYYGVATRPTTPSAFLACVGTYWALRAIRSVALTTANTSMSATREAKKMVDKSSSPAFMLPLGMGLAFDGAKFVGLAFLGLSSDFLSTAFFAVHVALR